MAHKILFIIKKICVFLGNNKFVEESHHNSVGLIGRDTGANTGTQGLTPEKVQLLVRMLIVPPTLRWKHVTG